MAPAEDINFNKGQGVLNVTVGSLVCMMCMVVLGLKLRWFRHRMHIAEAPSVQTIPAFTGSYRQCIDIDGFDFQRPLNTQATTPYPTNSIKHIGNSNHLRPKSSDTAIVHTNPNLPKSQYEQVPTTNNSITSSKAELKLQTVIPSVPPRAVKNTTPLPNTRRTGLFGRGKKSENITKKTDKKTEAKTKENNQKLSDQQSSATKSIAAAQNSIVYDGYEEPVQLRMKDKVIVSNESRNNVLPRSLPPYEHKTTKALVDNRMIKSVDDSYVSFDKTIETSIPTTGGALFETVKIKDNTNHPPYPQYKNPPEYMNYNNPIAVNTRGGDNNIDFGDDNDSYLYENNSDGFGSWDIVEQHRRSIAVTPIMASKISKDAADHNSKYQNKQSLNQQRATLKNDFDDSEA